LLIDDLENAPAAQKPGFLEKPGFFSPGFFSVEDA
jgi:hypothetical protein